LSAYFPELTLSPPLFYKWTVGIRFELNGSEPKIPSSGDSYFAAAVERAARIYEEAFSQTNYALIVTAHRRYVDWSIDSLRYSRKNRGKKLPDLFRFSKMETLGISGPSGKAIFSDNQDSTWKEVVTLRWAEIMPQKIGYGRIFEAIANQDFPSRCPQLLGEVYFVDPHKHVILHMYDDRGLDVIAKHSDSLRSLYSRHNAWILDHNRNQIDTTFTS
jgi:hypothetical protein